MRPIALGLSLLIILASITATSQATANPDELKWSRVNIPTEGTAGNWVLASGSDVQHLTMAIDGTLYCYASPSGTSYTLFKSTDGGYSWSYTGKVKDSIVALATAPDDASIIYYATSSNIYRSTDAGNNFVLLPANPGGAGSNYVEITSIDVAYLGYYIVVVGTRDTDNGEYGGIYTLDERTPFAWTDTNLGNYDVYAVASSPNFPGDRQLVAVVTDETDTLVTTKVGDAAWGATIGDARLGALVVATSADIAFPEDYDASIAYYVLFVAIDTGSGNGDVYRTNGAVATDLNIGFAYGLSNIDVTAVAVSGDAATANLLAGTASSQVYLSTDGGSNWTRSTKPPTGQSKTCVLMAPDFADSGKVYAATSGTESAFSISQDSGVTWNQIGVIDTDISEIVDLAVSPNYGQDDTLFMLTWGGEHSLWRSLNGGTRWERVFTSALANVDEIDKVKLSPNYNSSQVVFIAGAGGGNPAIWKSTDNGQTFNRRTSRDPTTGATFTIDIWAVVNDNTLFVGSFDAINNLGLVYGTTNSGFFYTTRAEAGSQSLNSIALSPDYEQDGTILVGNTNGWVYWSNDNGVSFEPLPPDASSAPITGSITVAFDPEYSRNKTVYAASNTADKGIYRFIIGTSTSWKSIDGTLPSGGMVSQLVVSAGGTLYATNFKADGGMERCLNPTYSLGPKFETTTSGLDDGATLSGLWLYESRLWSTDTTNTRLMTFTDSLTLPVTLTSPPKQAPGIGTIINYTISNVSLDWEALTGATSYQWQLDPDPDFSTVPAGFEGNTTASSTPLPPLEPATTYYWRVRAIEPALSPWSAKWSFTTSLGSTVTAPELYSPEAGSSGVPIKPVFQWGVIAGANSYELLVSTDASFGNPTILKIDAYALQSNTWQCNVGLNYDTTYYWKVKAIGSNSYSDWSAIGAFTTESPPPESVTTTPPPATPPPTPPPAPPQQTIPDWVIYLVGGLLLTIILVLTTILAVVIRRG